MEYQRTPEERIQRVKETINKGTKRDLESMTPEDLSKLVETRLKRVAKAERQREKRDRIEAAEYDRQQTRQKIYRLTNTEPAGNPFHAEFNEHQPSPQERAEALALAVEHLHQLEPEETARLITREISTKQWELESAKDNLPAAELQWELWDQYARMSAGRQPVRTIFIANALRERLHEEMITSSQYEEYSKKISGDKETAFLSPPRYYRHKIEHGLAVLETLLSLRDRFVPEAEQQQSTETTTTKPAPDIQPQLAQLREQARSSAKEAVSPEESSNATQPTPPVKTSFLERLRNFFRD